MGCLGKEAVTVKNENENEKENEKKETLINEPSKNHINKHSSDIKKDEDKKKESDGDKIALKMIKLNNNNKQNDKNEEEKKLIMSKVKNVDENQIKKNEVKDEETKEQKNDKNVIEDNINNKSDEKEIKNENEEEKEVQPNHDYVYVPSNFKKIKESIIAENIEDDHDKENNNIKLNVSEKSKDNLDLNKL